MIRPEDLAELATTLAQGANEVHWRTAIGRAYFAAFHRARELFRDLGFEPPKGDQSHAFLWRRLQNSGHTKLREAGHLLQQLRNARNVADYDILQKITRGDIAGLLPIVREIFTVLSDITEREGHDAADAMRKYERNVLGEQTWRGKPR